jgi:hypothetical protein
MPRSWDMRPDSIVRPAGLTLEMMDKAHALVDEWDESDEPMAWPLIVLLYELMVEKPRT